VTGRREPGTKRGGLCPGLLFGHDEGAVRRPLGSQLHGLVIGGSNLLKMVVMSPQPGGAEVGDDLFDDEGVRISVSWYPSLGCVEIL